jgi:hypothetical protein
MLINLYRHRRMSQEATVTLGRAKQGITGHNGAKQGITGQNGAKWAKQGITGQNGAEFQASK